MRKASLKADTACSEFPELKACSAFFTDVFTEDLMAKLRRRFLSSALMCFFADFVFGKEFTSKIVATYISYSFVEREVLNDNRIRKICQCIFDFEFNGIGLDL